jgi:hypothetical protein
MDYGLPEKSDIVERIDMKKKDGTIYGTTKKDTFFIDINNDSKKDKIIRGQFSNMVDILYTFYEIYLDNGERIAEFRTLEVYECFLGAYKFQFDPFMLTKASRPFGEESWTQPTKAKIERYQIINDKLEKTSEAAAGTICDVRELL